jgi:CCR4-NOT transcription complex subunit 3
MKNILPALLSPPESMSTLKTIAQDVINRTNNDISTQQQQQQQQLQLVQQQPQQQQQQQQQQLQLQQQQQQQLSDSRQTFFVDTNSSNGSNIASNSNMGNNLKSMETNEAHIPPLLGVAPLGPSPLQKEHQIQVIYIYIFFSLPILFIFINFKFQMMESAYYHMPTPSDSERLRTYLHRQSIQTPLHFPQVSYSFFHSFYFFVH